MKDILYSFIISCIVTSIFVFSCATPPKNKSDDQAIYIKTQELNTSSTFNGKYKYTVYVANSVDFYYYSSKKFTVGDTLDFELKDNYILP